jgi:hypothetical protein
LIDIAKLRELRVTCVTSSEDVRFCRTRLNDKILIQRGLKETLPSDTNL